jgi:(p)ppGpp synthase/HD superfamily hydrolase
VEHQLKAQGIKLRTVTRKEINRLAEGYVVAHREELLAQTWERVRTDRELLRFYEKEQRERQRWLERNSKHVSNSKRPAVQGLPVNETHAQIGDAK